VTGTMTVVRSDDSPAAIAAMLLAKRPRVVALHGPAGIGKTTLLRAIEDQIVANGVPLRRAVASPTARQIPFGALGVFLGRETNTVPAAIDDLRKLSGLLVIDDADLLDDRSATVVQSVSQERSVLLAIRADRRGTPDAVTRMVEHADTFALRLRPLGIEDAVRIIESHLGGIIDRRAAEQLHTLSDGNPLLLVETVETSRRMGSLREDGAVWKLVRAIPSAQVRELFRNQVRSWDAAVAAVVATVTLAESVPRVTVERLHSAAAVSEAEALDLIRAIPGNSLQVRHALLGEAVLAEFTAAQRTTLLRNLVESTDPAIVPAAQFGVWLLALGEHERLDEQVLLVAFRKALDDFNRPIAEALARLAYQHAPSIATASAMMRLKLLETTSSTDEQLLLESARGRFETYLIGIDGRVLPEEQRRLDNEERLQLEASLNAAQHATNDYARKHEVSVMIGIVEFACGKHTEAAAENLMRLADDPRPSKLGSNAGVIAALMASTALARCGRYYESLRILQNAESTLHALKPQNPNPYHLAQIVFSRAELQLDLGDPNADRTALYLADLEAQGNFAAGMYRHIFAALRSVASGRPEDAVRNFSAVGSDLIGIDPVGIGTWAKTFQRSMQAWAGLPGDPPTFEARMIGEYLTHERRLHEAIWMAETGRLGTARQTALEVSHDATLAGQHPTAMWAAHLATRIEPTRSAAALVESSAVHVDGDIAKHIALQAHALVDNDATQLEKSAQGFEELGMLSLAHESFVAAERAHRLRAQRSGALRCAGRASQLRDAGCRPAFDSRLSAQVEPGRLSVREREVAQAAADGLTHREIAEALGLSHRTVETHIHNVYRKLGINDVNSLRSRLNS
jgi:DNA-binding NarL/FixJ family response regulator